MPAALTSSAAITLLKERSRESLIEELRDTLTALGQERLREEVLAFLADLLLAAGADRDHLKQRLVSLLSGRFGGRSEQSSSEQLELFAQALRIASGQDPGSSGDTTSGDTDESTEPAPCTTKTAAELIEQTNDEVVAETKAQREARKAAAAARREHGRPTRRRPRWGRSKVCCRATAMQALLATPRSTT